MPYITAPNLRLYYERQGNGCPVLFLPGIGGDLRSHPNVFDTDFARAFDLLSFDQRGSGRSEKPEHGYTMAQYAGDAIALMDALGWHSAHVVGVSFGGMVAQELAIEYRQRVCSLSLCCTTTGGAGGSSYPLHELADLPPRERARKMLSIVDVRRDAQWQAEHPQETKRLLDQAAADASPFLREPGGIAGLTRQIEARSHHDTYARLPSLRVPTLVCGGRYDGQATPEAVTNLQRVIVGAELAFFDGGHRFLSEDPTAYARIAEFIVEQCHSKSAVR